MKPIVALVGRPNAGKSTLFNRITRSTDALVDDFPGVTRDRHFGDATWDEVEFTLVDTGGFSFDPEDPFSQKIREQVQIAIEDADAVVLLLDGKYGLSPFDQDMVRLLRESDKPVFNSPKRMPKRPPINFVEDVSRPDCITSLTTLTFGLFPT